MKLFIVIALLVFGDWQLLRMVTWLANMPNDGAVFGSAIALVLYNYLGVVVVAALANRWYGTKGKR